MEKYYKRITIKYLKSSRLITLLSYLQYSLEHMFSIDLW
nr:MAG TPA: hypothetical protein [Caudoviricetes sp.]